MFKENSVVCFLGDSIIAHGHMIRRIYQYYREKGLNLEIYNCAIPGDTAQNGLSRIHDTVFCYNPTDVVVSFGMNDIKYFLYEEADVTDSVILERRRAIDTNIENMRLIARECKNRGIKVTFFTTNPYDELSEGGPCLSGTAAALREVGERIKYVAKESGLDFIDGYSEFLRVMKKLFKEDIKIVNADRIHPNMVGQELLSEIFLKGQGFDVKIKDDYNELETALKLPFDEWEEERYKLEEQAKCTEFAEWIVCRGIKDERLIREIIEEKMQNEEIESIKNLSKAYLVEKENEEKSKEKLINHTRGLNL